MINILKQNYQIIALITKSVKLNSNHIILGYDIARKLNANIGERVSLFYPSDINIASNFVEYKDFEIYGILILIFLILIIIY